MADFVMFAKFLLDTFCRKRVSGVEKIENVFAILRIRKIINN